MDSLLHQIVLTLLPGIGTIIGKRLALACGSAEQVFREKKHVLLKIPGIGESHIKCLSRQSAVFKRAEDEIFFINKYKIRSLFCCDKDYPQRLLHCIDAPAMLYYKGTADLNSPRVVGMVGTRRATAYGREICEKLVDGLAGYGIQVISGLAFGIDTAAHKSALSHNIETVAVLGHGLDRIYPPQNRNLAEKMVSNGGLVTEYLSKTNPDKGNFPERNRIIAGLCDALVVIESGVKGGAIITANIADSYNRDIFAIPARIGDPWSEGCNYLIKTNKAALVQSAEDIVYMMGWDQNNAGIKPCIQKELLIEMKPEEMAIYKILKETEHASIDFIVMETKLSTSLVAAALLNLEFEGIVRSLPGKMFKLN